MASHIAHDDVVAWIEQLAQVMRDQRTYLTELDSAIGDADHGINMDRGFQAVLAKLPTIATGDIGALLKGVGMTLVSTVGGASGPLYGTLFLQLGGQTAGKEALDGAEFIGALEAGIAGVQRLGKAEPGDKTMLDALLPARDAMRSAVDGGASLSDALDAAVAAAEQGMHATTPLVARKGRASYLGERSAGHQDPGATSSYLLLKAAADALSRASGGPG
jgi:phosphoenolpyruvate---glycerone phosphotransferase subunit DhaL